MVQHTTDRAFEDQERGGQANRQQRHGGNESYPTMEDKNEFTGVHIEIDFSAGVLFHFFFEEHELTLCMGKKSAVPPPMGLTHFRFATTLLGSHSLLQGGLTSRRASGVET